MNQEKVDLAFGALLHDVGKVVQRGISEHTNHSNLGVSFLKDVAARGAAAFRPSASVLDQVRYHHGKDLSVARLPHDSLAYITYFADNVSAGMDRKDKDDAEEWGFDRNTKLRRIFNIVNGHNDDNTVEHEDYNAVRERIAASLATIAVTQEGIGSAIDLLEATTSSIPSSTNRRQLADVSLFDHSKTTAAIACCLYDYLVSVGEKDYRRVLVSEAKSAYARKMFLLWSCDMSGIQSFIYQISGEKALKQLRARSFYLDLLLEDILDELMERLDLSRANILYAGGGHAYALLPNTQACVDELNAFFGELRTWFLGRYKTDLYLAQASVACSADDLGNKGPDEVGATDSASAHRGSQDAPDPYASLYRVLSERLSAAKESRYSAAQLLRLNYEDEQVPDRERECVECHRSDHLRPGHHRCDTCESFASISAKLVRDSLADPNDRDRRLLFAVSDASVQTEETDGVPLPFNRRLLVMSQDAYLRQRPDVIRLYAKNDWDTGTWLATHLWMGDYTADQHGEGMSDYAEDGVSLAEGQGIKRLGVLRADVDNLGACISQGFPASKASLSRTATLSRSLSFFFKYRINGVLKAGGTFGRGGYRVQIVYSGGDDVFLVGNWSDVLCAACDLHDALDEFTGNGVLTISAGIGMFPSKYPIARMAEETGALEEAAKAHPNKDAIALWSPENVFSWEEFQGGVIPKLQRVRSLFERNEKGKAFIYRMVELLRGAGDDPISVPRLAYLLARSFEDAGSSGQEASAQLFDWAMDADERRQLLMALEWYVYSIRERG